MQIPPLTWQLQQRLLQALGRIQAPKDLRQMLGLGWGIDLAGIEGLGAGTGQQIAQSVCQLRVKDAQCLHVAVVCKQTRADNMSVG